MLVLIYLHVKNKIHQIFFSEDIAKILPTYDCFCQDTTVLLNFTKNLSPSKIA